MYAFLCVHMYLCAIACFCVCSFAIISLSFLDKAPDLKRYTNFVKFLLIHISYKLIIWEKSSIHINNKPILTYWVDMESLTEQH